MKNKLTDLNNHLFAQLERLDDEDLEGDKLKDELDRAKAIASISSQLISSGNLALKVKIATGDKIKGEFQLPPMLEG